MRYKKDVSSQIFVQAFKILIGFQYKRMYEFAP